MTESPRINGLKTEKERDFIAVIKGIEALESLSGNQTQDRGETIAKAFIEQMDKYYSSPNTGFHDNKIAKRFYQQRLDYLKFTPYPKDGLVTFGASGTAMCDRQISFKNSHVRPKISHDLPHRGRQRRMGSAIIEYFQLDLAHMEKRLGNEAEITLAETEKGEYAMEDASQKRKVFDHNGVKFAITAKPDGIFNYKGEQLLFEYKTKAGGIKAYNGKLDYKGAQDDHLRQVTAESLLFGIREGLIVYESTQKPAWFSDEEMKSVTKGQKTWKEGEPTPDLRGFYFYITDAMQQTLLDDLSEQAKIVYSEITPKMKVEMTNKCGFCKFIDHCKNELSQDEKVMLFEVEKNMSRSSLSGKYEHRNLQNYLIGVSNE